MCDDDDADGCPVVEVAVAVVVVVVVLTAVVAVAERRGGNGDGIVMTAQRTERGMRCGTNQQRKERGERLCFHRRLAGLVDTCGLK